MVAGAGNMRLMGPSPMLTIGAGLTLLSRFPIIPTAESSTLRKAVRQVRRS